MRRLADAVAARCRRLRSRCRRGPVHDLGARAAASFRARSDFAGPGTPAIDDWQRSEYDTAADVLGARGANVVWLTIPCTPNYPSTPGSPTWYVNERTIAGAARDRGLRARPRPRRASLPEPPVPFGVRRRRSGAARREPLLRRRCPRGGALDVADPARRCRAADRACSGSTRRARRFRPGRPLPFSSKSRAPAGSGRRSRGRTPDPAVRTRCRRAGRRGRRSLRSTALRRVPQGRRCATRG